MESFGETLVHIRKGKGLTQTDIARRMTDLGYSAGILGYSIAEMKAFEENLSYKNQPFSYKNDILDI